MTTDERLENLERELARAKRRNRWLLAAVGVAVVIIAMSGPPDTLAQIGGKVRADEDCATGLAAVYNHKEQKTEVYVLWGNGAVTTPFLILPRGQR